MEDKQRLFQEIKEDPSKLEELLTAPARPLWDVPTESLRIKTMPCGFDSLDNYLFLKEDRGELVIVAGGTSSGKSSFMFQTAFNVARKHPVLVYSLEMDHEQILTRYIASKINKSLPAIQNGSVPVSAIERAKNEIKDELKVLVDCRTKSLSSIVDTATTEVKKSGVKLVVIDYLQIVSVGTGHSRVTEVAEISRTLKALAMDLKVPVMVGAQINRNASMRGQSTGNYRPMLYDLRESGSIEQDADEVLMIHRPSQFDSNNRPGEADILLVKNRNGPTGEINMEFVATQTRFLDKGSYL